MYTDFGLNLILCLLAALNARFLKSVLAMKTIGAWMMFLNFLVLFYYSPYIDFGMATISMIGIIMMNAGFMGVGYWLYKNAKELCGGGEKSNDKHAD